MKNQLPKLLALSLSLLTVFGVITSAGATQITVNSNLAGGTIYTSQDVNGQFDIQSSLPAGNYQSPYVITGASVNFDFVGILSYQYQGEQTVYEGWTNNKNYTDVTQTYFSPGATAGVQIGNQFTSDGAPSYSDSQSSYQTLDKTQSYQYCDFVCSTYTDYWYTNHYTVDYGYSGEFSIGYGLDTSNLNQLSNTGVLDFSLDVGNEAQLLSAQLVLDISPNPEADPPGNSVPEPTSLALMSIASLGALYARGKKKSKRS